MLIKLQSAISLVTCGCLVSLGASPSSIGFVVTNGEAVVDGATVQRNSTLFQGSLVRTGDTTSDLMLPGGSNLLLQPGSSANVYSDHAILRQGTATERGGHGYVVFADGLRVSTPSPDGAFVVGLKDRSHLDVSAQGAAAEVRSSAGVLLARLDAGKSLGFAVQDPPQTPAAPANPRDTPATATPGAPEPGQQLTMHGIVRKDHAGSYGHYLLTDVNSHLTVELRGGAGMDDLVGGSVEVTGTVLATNPAGGASRVLSVSDIHQMTMSEISPETAEPAPAPERAPAAAPPTPAGDATAAGPGPETSAQPAASAPAEPGLDQSAPPPLPVHSDTAKVLIIVGLAAGAGVGVALGLAGGNHSTVSPE